MHSNCYMKYYDKIDGLRFVAIFLVLAAHFTGLSNFIYIAYYGVDLFFVISGFLITTILLKPNNSSFKHNYKNFIGRRTLRIFPIYYLTILILWLLNFPFVRLRLIWLLTYTMNYQIVYMDFDHVGHFWSLCVEEQFYLVWPFIVLSFKNKKAILTAIIIAIILIGYAQLIFNIFPALSIYNYFGLLTRMSSLGLGALGAVLAAQNLLPEKLFRNKLFECFMLVVLGFSLSFNYIVREPILNLCSFYLVVKAANYDFSLTAINTFLRNKKIIHIGTLAYGIYIFHLPIKYYLTPYVFNPIWLSINFKALGIFKFMRWQSWIIKFPLYSFLSFLLASISYKYIETPFLKLKDKYFKY